MEAVVMVEQSRSKMLMSQYTLFIYFQLKLEDLNLTLQTTIYIYI